jgi:hypothetical protein
MAKMYRVYSIIERPKHDDYWLNIGVAFPHEDGKGFNVMLQRRELQRSGIKSHPSVVRSFRTAQSLDGTSLGADRCPYSESRVSPPQPGPGRLP